MLIVGYLAVRWLYAHEYFSDSEQQTANVALNWGALVYAIYLTKVFADTQKRTKENPVYKLMDELADEMGDEFKDPEVRRLYIRAFVKMFRHNRPALHRYLQADNGEWDGIRTLGEALRESKLTKEEMRGFFSWIKMMGEKSEVRDLKNQLVGYRYDLQSMEGSLNRMLRVYHQNQKDVNQTIELAEKMLPLMPAIQKVYGERLERAKTLNDKEKEELVKSILRR